MSKEAVKAKKKYSKLGTVIKLLVVDPKKIKMWKVKLQRLNFNLIGKINPKSDGAHKEELTLGGIRTRSWYRKYRMRPATPGWLSSHSMIELRTIPITRSSSTSGLRFTVSSVGRGSPLPTNVCWPFARRTWRELIRCNQPAAPLFRLPHSRGRSRRTGAGTLMILRA